MNRRRKKKESPIKMVFLILIAVLVMAAAIYVVIAVFGKIRSDYSQLDFTKEEETTHIEIEVDEEPKVGWNESEEGWRYYLDEKKYVADQWNVIDGYLYHFGEDGLMDTGEWKEEGQIFTLHDTKGYLKNIETDLDYVPESTGENLDSLARTNAFWCFRKEEEGTSPFRTILYRRTVENKIMELGGESSPERTTKNSMRAYGDYVYFLPKVKQNQFSGLTEAEKALCDKLFRMIPGRDTKELIAENVDGYIVLDNTIYYSQAGQIKSAVSGVEVAVGEGQYSVVIKDESCYLVDALGNPAVADSTGSIAIGDRVYRIEEDGKIKYVKHGQDTIDGSTYYLSGSGSAAYISVKKDGRESTLIRENYGVQSYCIVDKQIYYSSYVDKSSGGVWFSQIFKTDLEGQNKQTVSERFPGVIQNMYYYEDEAQIIAEYNPAIWEKAYGEAVVISPDGNIYKINDTAARTGKSTSGNDMLEIVMAKDGKLTCLWHDCQWSRDSGITSVLWSKAIEMNTGDKTLIEMKAPDVPEETQETEEPTETEPVIQPIGTPPSNPETTVPSNPSINNDPLISTGKPGQETVAPVPVVPPVTESSDEVKIVPIG